MNSRIKRYVDELFEDAPKSRRIYEIKEEILANVNDNYNDLIESGMDSNTAYNRAIANIGNVEELIQKNSTTKERRVRSEISSIISSITLILYFVISFTFENWEISWVIFLIGGLVKKVYFTFCDMKENDKYESK